MGASILLSLAHFLSGSIRLEFVSIAGKLRSPGGVGKKRASSTQILEGHMRLFQPLAMPPLVSWKMKVLDVKQSIVIYVPLTQFNELVHRE